MAQPTAQDLIDALARLTQALAAVQQKQAAAPAGPGTPFVGNPNPNATPSAAAPPTDPAAKSAGPMKGKLSRLRQAYQAFKGGKKAFQTFQRVRGLARAGKYGQAFQAGRKGFGAAFRGMGGAGGAAGGAGGAAGAAGAAAGAAAAIVLVVEALIAFRRHTIQTTEALIQAQQQLAEFSPSMAAVMARRQMLEIQRDIKKGEALSASANELVAAEQRRKDAELPFEVLWDRFKNNVEAAANDWLAGATKQVADFLGLNDEQRKNADLIQTIQAEVDAEMKRKDAARKRLGDAREAAKVIGRKRGR